MVSEQRIVTGMFVQAADGKLLLVEQSFKSQGACLTAFTLTDERSHATAAWLRRNVQPVPVDKLPYMLDRLRLSQKDAMGGGAI